MINNKKGFDFIMELDKFFDDYEKSNKKFKLFIEFEDIDTTYESKPFNMDNVSIKLKEDPKTKINIIRNKNIIKSNKNSIF